MSFFQFGFRGRGRKPSNIAIKLRSPTDNLILRWVSRSSVETLGDGIETVEPHSDLDSRFRVWGSRSSGYGWGFGVVLRRDTIEKLNFEAFPN